MYKKITVLIQSDPRKSHRPCEGIRLALGMASGGHPVSVLLAQKGMFVLYRDREDWVDEDRLEKFLSILDDFSPIFFADEASTAEAEPAKMDREIHLLSKTEFALKIAEADCLFIF